MTSRLALLLLCWTVSGCAEVYPGGNIVDRQGVVHPTPYAGAREAQLQEQAAAALREQRQAEASASAQQEYLQGQQEIALQKEREAQERKQRHDAVEEQDRQHQELLRQNAAAQEQLQSSPAWKSTVYSAAVCVFVRYEKRAEDAYVSYTYAGVTTTRFNSRAHVASISAGLANKIRERAAKERVKIIPCSKKVVTKLVGCHFNELEDCESETPQTDALQELVDEYNS